MRGSELATTATAGEETSELRDDGMAIEESGRSVAATHAGSTAADLKTGSTEKASGTPTTAAAKPKSRDTIKMYKTTIIAVLVTVVFFLSFVPYLALSSQPDRPKDRLRGTELAVYQIFYSFPFLNAVANPIIYGAWNPKFRTQCARMLKKMFCRGSTGQLDIAESESGLASRTTSS
jgi:hypothetical protein